MAVAMIGPKFYAWDKNGKPLAFGKLYTYQARTNVPKPTYQSEDQVVENTNPVILNGEGYANVYLDGSYKMVLKDSDDNEIWSSDPVTSAKAEEWVNCMPATYLSPTSFKVSGNFTSEFDFDRRVRIDSNSAEYEYSSVVSSSYAAGETTVIISTSSVTTGIQSVCTSIIGIESTGKIDDLSVAYYFNTAIEMISSSIEFPENKNLITKGYYEAGDGGGSEYVIKQGASPEPVGSPVMTGDKYADIQIKKAKPALAQFGVRDDPGNECQQENTIRIQACLNKKGKVQGIQNATFFLTKEITVGEYTTYYAKQANHKQDSTWSYSGTSYKTVIVLGDASSQTGDNLKECHVIGAIVEEEFLGNASNPTDIDNILNYTSIANYGIRAQRTDESSISKCTVSGMETSGIGAEWSNNFLYQRNKITTSRIHGIANQGGTAVARSHKVKDNLIIGCGGMAFDINTAAGGTVELSGNICRNVRQFYKCTDGSAYSSNNECYSWDEQDDIYSAYGNSQGLNCVNDKLFNFGRLTASGSIGANYQWTNITYISNNGALLTVFDDTTYNISDSVISITTDKNTPIVAFASTGNKSGFSLSITDCDLFFDTTLAANSAGFGVFSLANWKDANIDISNNKKFVCVGLSSQRIVVGLASDIASSSGLAVIDGNNIESTGFDSQLGMYFKDSHNCRVSNNNLKGIALGSYETTEDFAVNFIQHTNFSDVQFTVSIGSNNRIYDYLSIGRSGTVAPSGNKTPNRIGERYFHWTIGDFYQAYGTGNTQWHKLN